MAATPPWASKGSVSPHRILDAAAATCCCPPMGWHLGSTPCSHCGWQQGGGVSASSQERFKCFHFILLGFFCSLVGGAGVSQVRRSFMTTQQGWCSGSK